MEDYAACPPRERDRDLDNSGEHISISGDGERLHGTEYSYNDVSVRSSLDLSLRYPEDPHVSTPPSTHDQSTQIAALPQTNAAPSPRKGKMVQHLKSGYATWKTTWRLQTVIVGFYVLALLCAAAHCWFFVYLNGRILSPDIELAAKTTTIPQGYVTTISFLLVTAFRASLVASVGVCYTQHLWATLREKVLKVGLIEDLFQVQTNAMHFASLGLYIKTPVLAAVALFCWLVPIATVYPPGALIGALIVTLQISTIAAKFNVSVLHTNDIMHSNWSSLSTIRCGDHREVPRFPEQAQNASYLSTCWSCWPGSRSIGCFDIRGLSFGIPYLAASSLISGELAPLPQSGGDNASYTIEFWGPDLSCETHNRTVVRTIQTNDTGIKPDSDGIRAHDSFNVYGYTEGCILRSSPDDTEILGDPKIIDLKITDFSMPTYRYHPCVGNVTSSMPQPMSGISNLPAGGINSYVPFSETVCRPQIRRFSVSISYSGGIQTVNYDIRDEGPVPAYSRSFRHFSGSFEQWVQLSDAWTIYYEFARNFNRSEAASWSTVFQYPNASEASSILTLENGTAIETCNLTPIGSAVILRSQDYDSAIWKLSVFARRLHTDSNDCLIFDPTMARDLLINTTINALSLGERFDVVLGNTTRVFNVYSFQDKQAFFLPYGLALGLGIPIIALGLAAFYTRNQRVSAITGGFLQILMTTTGRRSLDDIIVKGSGTMGGQENVSDALKEASIRFGELVADGGRVEVRDSVCSTHAGRTESLEPLSHDNSSADESAGLASGVEFTKAEETAAIQAGFGTADEVRPLRKRCASR
ncbi:hypothetical protein C7974DRAFT_38251 [Boeremia exigua]|uniref:uncharacterized protein n=1 Tax=Boeremia exigua TaxID=749465 RepID=UPI001E8D110A|nr:uncharacterized protein C7974DRAFT_38251 [Boeremia exigua]KAH6618853.1 hypothetical protein C7974DRAFT_38251 [Boeremia exigua]